MRTDYVYRYIQLYKKKTGIAGRTVRLKRMVLDVMKLR